MVAEHESTQLGPGFFSDEMSHRERDKKDDRRRDHHQTHETSSSRRGIGPGSSSRHVDRDAVNGRGVRRRSRSASPRRRDDKDRRDGQCGFLS
jgi:hypothetical protein